MDHLAATLFKVLAPAAGIVILLGVSRRKGISWTRDLGLGAPRPGVALAWLILWVGVIVVEERLIDQLGMAQAKPWPAYPPLIVGLRVLALGVLGPTVEELLFRGLLLHLLGRTRLGSWGAVGVCAAGWSAMHLADPATSALMFFDGLLFGAARITSRSTWVPIGLHIVGNLFSVSQSLGL